MQYRFISIIFTIFFVLSLFSFSSPAYAQRPLSSLQHTTKNASGEFPAVDPDYIYDQLSLMATRYQHREAGYDAQLPPTSNGHDEFADYWSQEVARDLQGFNPQIQRDEFPVQGWRGRPTTVPAFNVEVSVPGATHPEQVVVIGCHYDGEAVSTQSANDDASGCAIELGVAKAMGEYWRSHHTYPARTLRFVIFDAEEQGLYGSFHYLNSTINGDIQNVVAMFNEEQNGIAYPLRYLGRLENPLMPLYTEVSPLTNSDLYPDQTKLSPAQRNSITHFRTLMQQALTPVFAQFQAMGYMSLSYHDKNKQDVMQSIFTPEHISNVRVEDDVLGSSDQVPFTLAGVPCATFAGNSTYYEPNAPAGSYPYDQKQDTIQLMNTFATGGPNKSNALKLALALPGMLTTWMLHQSDILGDTTVDSLPAGPITAISDVGLPQAGKALTFNAKASFDPKASSSPLSYAWDFGDGSKASGVSVEHTYTSAGTYTLTLTANSGAGSRRISKTLTVADQPVTHPNPYERYQSTGFPPSNPNVILPVPDTTLSDRTTAAPGSATATTAPTTPKTSTTPSSSLSLIIGILVVLLIVAGIGFLIWRRRQRVNTTP